MCHIVNHPSMKFVLLKFNIKARLGENESKYELDSVSANEDDQTD